MKMLAAQIWHEDMKDQIEGNEAVLYHINRAERLITNRKYLASTQMCLLPAGDDEAFVPGSRKFGNSQGETFSYALLYWSYMARNFE